MCFSNNGYELRMLRIVIDSISHYQIYKQLAPNGLMMYEPGDGSKGKGTELFADLVSIVWPQNIIDQRLMYCTCTALLHAD